MACCRCRSFNARPGHVWIAFLVNGLIGGALGLVLAGGVKWRPNWFYRRWVMTMLATVLALALGVTLDNLFGSSILLTVVVAVWIGQLLISERWFEFALGCMRRTLSAVIAIAVVGSLGMSWMARDNPGTKLSDAAGARAFNDSSNVLLITLSSVGSRQMGLYGYERDNTPRLASWAKRGVVFEQAWSVGSWSFPVHATLFTGQFPYEHGVDWATPLESAQPTLADVLNASQVDTYGLVANGWYLGPEGGLSRGFRSYRVAYPDYLPWTQSTSLGRMALAPWWPLPRTTAEELNGQFLQWIDSRPQEHPFFAFLNYFDAHAPYWVPDEEFDRFAILPERQQNRLRQTWAKGMPDNWYENADAVALARDTHDAAIAYLDAQVGELLDELDHRSVLDTTWVIVLADNGEQFGQHDQYGHGFNLYREVLQVPLLVIPPGGISPGGRIEMPVSLLDVPRTIGEAVGVELPSSFRGDSLARFWQTAEPTASEIPHLSQEPRGFEPGRLNSQGLIHSLVWQGWHYLRYEGLGRESLFDTVEDPEEVNDLAENEASQKMLLELRGKLDELLSAGVPSQNPRYTTSEPAPGAQDE